MKLVDNWRRVITRAWSSRLLFVATALGLVESLLPYFSDTMPRGRFVIASVLAGFAALVARIVAQPTLHTDA